MQNPILQMLNGNSQSKNKNTLDMIKMFMAGKNPQTLFNDMLQTNPQFKKFVEDNRNKSIEDIAMEYDIDLSILKQLM